MNGQVNIWHEVIPQWIAACGTVAAVIVALFGNLIRNKFNKPKIEISCGKDTPFIEKNTENYQVILYLLLAIIICFVMMDAILKRNSLPNKSKIIMVVFLDK